MPDWKQIVRERLASLQLADASESEICQELAEHLEDRYDELRLSGLPEEEAARLALEPLDSHPTLVEALRRSRTPMGRPRAPEPPPRHANWLAVLIYDLRLALRAMRQKPGFSVMVIGMLALGIAGNAAIFSAFNSLFLKPLPFTDSGRLIDITETAPRWNLQYVGIADPDFLAWNERNTTFDSMAFFRNPDFNLSRLGPAQHIRGAMVTIDMLKVLRLQPVLGRNFLPAEERPGGDRAALISFDFWQRMFNGDRNVLGRLITLDDQPYKIVGVLPREAVFPDRAEVWVPLQISAAAGLAHGWYGAGIGRMKPGVTTAEAAADLLRIHKSLVAAGQKANEMTFPMLTPLRARYLGDYRATSQVLFVAVAVVLLIVCVNIAALMLVRASGRAQEMAIRSAMGASRGRILGQLLTENGVLAVAGGVAGVLLGRLALQAMVSLLPDSMPRWIDFSLDSSFVVFCVLLTAAAAMLSGWMPALQGSRADMRGALHESGLRATISRARRGTLNALVVTEIGLALALLITSGLLLRAFYKVTHVDPGFRPENVLTFDVDLPEEKYAKAEQTVDFYRDLLDQLRSLPGVAAVAAASAPPLGGHWGQFIVAQDDPPPAPNQSTPIVLQVVVTPGYFETIGMTALAGRTFDARDGESKDRPVAIVSETFARQHWPGANAIGRHIRYERVKGSPWWEVVGVMHDEKHYGLDGEERAAIYTPERQLPFPMSLKVVIRARSNPEALAAPARRIVERLDPDLAVYEVSSMTGKIDRSLWVRRAYSWLFGVFSLVALALAAAGIYGVISYAVAQRTHEIGIRMALGASPREVLAGILGGGMMLVAAGGALGVALSLAAAGLLDKLLFGISPRDPLVYATVALAVGTVGLLANALPARRAASLDPMRALRSE